MLLVSDLDVYGGGLSSWLSHEAKTSSYLRSIDEVDEDMVMGLVS